jgi:hypothetical protein
MSFFHGAPIGNSFVDYGATFNETILNTMRTFATDPTRYQNLSKHECLASYSNPFFPHANLFVVVEDSEDTANASLLEYKFFPSGSASGQIWDQQMWICSSSSDCCHPSTQYYDSDNPDCQKKDFSDRKVDHWEKFDYRVQHCLTKRNNGDYCSLNFSPLIVLGQYMSVRPDLVLLLFFAIVNEPKWCVSATSSNAHVSSTV